MSVLSVITGVFRNKVVLPMRNLLREGMTPHKLAATVALGSMVGLVPALGVTTVMSTALAARFRLNIAATVLVSYLVHPLQLLLAIPFIQAGVRLMGLSTLRLSLSEMRAMFTADWLDALNQLWQANLAGIAVWALMALPTGGVLYLLLVPIFRRVLPKPQGVVA